MITNVWLLLLVLVVVSVALVAWQVYLWRRLIRDTVSNPRIRLVGLAVALMLAVLIPVAAVTARTAGWQSLRVLYYVGYGWLGLAMLITIPLIVMDLLRGAWWLRNRLKKPNGPQGEQETSPADPERRQWMARAGAAAAVVLGVGETAQAVRNAFGAWTVERWRVELPRFPEKLEGFRLVQISDVHVGATRGPDYLPELVRTVATLEPDAVVITGDLVDGSVQMLGKRIEVLGRLQPPHGVYFVTGNHEYYSGAREWILFLEHLGIEVLENRRVRLGRDGESFDLVGVDDWAAARFETGHEHDMARAMKDVDPKRVQVLLAHQPVTAWQAAEHRVDLMLSGHTHGGQIFPWNFVVRLQQPFVRGMHRVRDTLVYVNRGAGFWGPPMRLGATPELTVLELHPAAGSHPQARRLAVWEAKA